MANQAKKSYTIAWFLNPTVSYQVRNKETGEITEMEYQKELGEKLILELDDDLVLISLLDGDLPNLEVVEGSIDLTVGDVRPNKKVDKTVGGLQLNAQALRTARANREANAPAVAPFTGATPVVPVVNPVVPATNVVEDDIPF